MTRDLLFIAAMGIVGLWLESKGGIHGVFDRMLTPWPFGLGAVGVVLLEHFA